MKKIIISETLSRDLDPNGNLFGRKSITVQLARSSEEILGLHGAQGADLIITEHDLPFMGGERLCSRIRSDHSLKTVSIILVCADAPAAIAECGRAKANAVITRPVSPADLYSKVSELLVVPQRRDVRIFLNLSVRGSQGSSSFQAITRNMSVSGMLLETDHALKEGDAMQCVFALGSREVRIDCSVVRVIPTASRTRLCGTKFVNLNAATYVLLEHFLKSMRPTREEG